ncbi:fibrinogen beta chain-like [Gadus chalcogrammus]|uniref:fibrinogen beta chain-like n=1 Tax=Gadus chalcogrammus TaxID=1042646 RepID=UPI0024C49FD4|nr:fibrinogen beta chain-like [Gadus chalcogrammus]
MRGGAITLGLLQLLLLVELGHTAALSDTLEVAHNITHLTRCQSERKAALLLPPMRSYVPTCDDDGNFTPMQCWAPRGYCWCVNNYTRVEIPGTRTPPGNTPPRCKLLVELDHTAALSDTLEVAHNITHLTRCQSKREAALLLPPFGSYVPTCDDDGNFTPMQCWASTGYCWCVNIYTGVEIRGTRTPPGKMRPRCGQTSHVPPTITHLTRCQSEREADLFLPPMRSYVPTCDDDGNFTPMQCWASTGYCWCVNIYTGVEIPGTRTPPGNTPPRCKLLVELDHTAALSDTLEVAHNITHLTRCQSEREAARLLPLIGSYVPTCDDDGNFTPVQCSASTGSCWCVNIYTGVEIPGPRTPPGNMPPRCASDHEPFTGDLCPPGVYVCGPRGQGSSVDTRGSRPVSSGRDTYSPNRHVLPPITTGRSRSLSSITRYRGRPTAAPVGGKPEALRERPVEAGGCTHASDQLGVLCPTGCELKTTILKQETNIKQAVAPLSRQVDELSRSSNNIYSYVERMSNALRERQKVVDGNGQVVSQYTDTLEEQHAYIKETIDTAFPSDIRLLQGALSKIREKIQKLEKAIQTQQVNCREPCVSSCPIPVVSGKECEDIFRKGGVDSQMYLVQSGPLSPGYKVFCDQTTKDGGWLLIQNRMDGSVGFGRRWDDYRRGFGNVAFDVGKGHCETPGEYWLGNEHVSQLTNMGPTEVLFEMEDWSQNKVHAMYSKFTIQSESSNYLMSVDGYSGTAGNTLEQGATELYGENRTMTIHNGMMFSTFDRDNDKWIPGDSSKQCSMEDGGGWWYNRCHSANPNGRYYMGGAYTSRMAKHGTDDGMVWMNWKGSWFSLKTMSMKIRPFFQGK